MTSAFSCAASHDNQFRDIFIRNSRHFGVFMAQNIDSTFAGKAQPDCTNNSFTKSPPDNAAAQRSA